MKASPVGYIQKAKLRGKLFNADHADGLVSCADAGFYVDHEEPLEALGDVRKMNEWPFGELVDGHEFVVLVRANPRARSKSTSPRRSASV